MKNQNIFIRSAEVMQQGITHVNDILTNTGQLLGYNEFKETYSIAKKIVDFYGIRHSFPRDWLKGHRRKLNDSEMKPVFITKSLATKTS